MSKQSLSQPLTLEHFKSRVKRLKNVADTRLVSGKHRLFLPAGGITVVAGSPGEGKTSLMLNLLRNLLRSELRKKFYFFSYEEPDIYLALKLLMIGSNVVLAEDNLEAFVKHFQVASWRGSDKTNGKLAHAVDEFGSWIGEGRLHLDDHGLDLYVLDEKSGLPVLTKRQALSSSTTSKRSGSPAARRYGTGTRSSKRFQGTCSPSPTSSRCRSWLGHNSTAA